MAAAISVVHFFGDGLLVFLLAATLIVTGAIAAVGGYLQFRRVDVAIREGRPIGSGPAAHTLSIAMLLCLVLASAYVITRGL
jgi:putative membrane protein